MYIILFLIVLIIFLLQKNREGYVSSNYREVKTEKGNSGYLNKSLVRRNIIK